VHVAMAGMIPNAMLTKRTSRVDDRFVPTRVTTGSTGAAPGVDPSRVGAGRVGVTSLEGSEAGPVPTSLVAVSTKV
jgi:hypothetical protein